MRRFKLLSTIIIAWLFLPVVSPGQVDPLWNTIIGSAVTEGRAHAMLRRLTDEAGGRLVGTPSNERGLSILEGELNALGISVRREPFTIPGWVRGEDEVAVTAPLTRRLRAVALGYTDARPVVEDTAVFAGSGAAEEYARLRAAGKIVIVSSATPRGKEPLLRLEVIGIAADHGARAVCFINDREGGLVLCGVADFEGKPARIPAYSLTLEEGSWIERLLKAGKPVTMKITTRSKCVSMPTANLVATLPGSAADKIVIGAHVDGWDIGQAALDNGIGSAILFDVARLLKQHAPKNAHTIELVWFNGEELGLWGSKVYVKAHQGEPIAAMVNLDMTGSPRKFDAGGFDELVPFLSGIAGKLGGIGMEPEAGSSPGTNSDHEPFMLEGIPAVSVWGHLDPDKVRYYHDFGDTFEKADARGLAEASAVTAVLAREMARRPAGSYARKSRDEVITMLKKGKVDERLKRQKEWPFD